MRRVSLCAVEVVTGIANLVLDWVAVGGIYAVHATRHATHMQHDTQHAGNADKNSGIFLALPFRQLAGLQNNSIAQTFKK